MNTEVRTLVLVPRYTTFASARTFATPPINIREFAYVDVTAWRGPAIGSSTAFAIGLEVSSNLEYWKPLLDENDLTTFDPATETSKHYDLASEWLRTVVTLYGTRPAYSCWAIGAFATRTPRTHGG